MNTFDIPAYTLIRSDRRSLSLEIRPDCSLVVRAPKRLGKREIDAFVFSRRAWIERKLPEVERRAASPTHAALTEDEIRALYEKAKEILPPKIAGWAKIMKTDYTGITITGAEKRFGSCSGKNRLSFSYRLMLYPEEAIDYVVVHELAHTVHHNHSEAFYALVARYLPDHKMREKLLKE